MGNREELLKGARKCLLEKGYVQTTARDIAKASGVGLAAIGYHFGTKEALLQEAMVEANQEWAERIDIGVATMQPPGETPFPEWFEQCWGRIINTSQDDQRLLQASIEVLLNVDESTPVCASIEDGMQCGRDALVTFFGHDDEDLSTEERDALGGLYHALMIGIRLLHAATPARAPSPEGIAMAMKIISRKFCDANSDARSAISTGSTAGE
jgi:AcrR family transcriptional regulator